MVTFVNTASQYHLRYIQTCL